MNKMAGYRKQMPVLWWTRRWAHIRFICRELTSLAVGYTAVLLVLLCRSVLQGEEAFGRFAESLQATPIVVWHAVVLCALAYHSITWFNLAPKAMIIKVGRTRIPDAMVLGGNYAGWIAISLLVLWFIMR
jgi:fumarate reductase subunit C